MKEPSKSGRNFRASEQRLEEKELLCVVICVLSPKAGTHIGPLFYLFFFLRKEFVRVPTSGLVLQEQLSDLLGLG